MLYIAIALSLALGIGWSLNAWIVKYYMKEEGFTAMRINIDAFMLAGTFMFGIFLYYQTKTPMATLDICVSVLVSFLFILGSICLATALQSG